LRFLAFSLGGNLPILEGQCFLKVSYFTGEIKKQDKNGYQFPYIGWFWHYPTQVSKGGRSFLLIFSGLHEPFIFLPGENLAE